MSEHKSWLWRKKSSGKGGGDDDPSSKAHEQEIHQLLSAKAELERDLRELNEKLAFTVSECNENEQLANKNAKTAQEALAGWEKAEAKVLSLKEELTEAMEERAAGEKRTKQLEAALKECMQQLRFVREEQEQRIHSVMEKSAKDYEQKKLVFESQLLESANRIAELDAELYQLSGALLQKDRFIEDLTQLNARAEDEIKQLIRRAESAEKTNASLQYEVRVLEKELEIRNEEKEFNRRTADAAHKQHLENSKKIAKLESECQRLRVLVRKRLPGPAALAKMKSEVDLLERGSSRKSNNGNSSSRLLSYNGNTNMSVDFGSISCSPPPDESPRRKINVLVEKMCLLEEENHGLKETLLKMTGELQVTKSMYTHAATKLAQVENQLDESSKSRMIMELTAASANNTNNNGGSFTPRHDFCPSVRSEDIGSEDKDSCSAAGWASELMDQFRDTKGKNGGNSSRMSCRSNATSEINLMDDFAEMEKLALVSMDKPPETGTNLALVVRAESESESAAEVITGREIVPVSTDSLPVNSSPKPLEASISKLIQIIEATKLQQPPPDSSSAPNSMTVRLLQWKTSELGSTLQEFLHCCYDVLNGRADFPAFAQRAASTLDWMINHCFSLQDVSSMRDAIKKQLDWDEEPRSECELDVGIDKLLLANRDREPPVTASPGKERDNRAEIVRVKDEMRQLESSRRELEGKLVGSGTDGAKQQEAALPNTNTTTTTTQSEKQQQQPISDCKSEDQGRRQDDENQSMTIAAEEVNEKHSHPPTDTETETESVSNRSLELQVHNESAKPNEEPVDQEEEKQVHNDWEITTASKTLAQCQETILNLGKQLKALAAPEDAVLFEKVIASPATSTEAAAAAAEPEKAITTPSTTSETSNVTVPNDKKSLSQRASLLDQMLADDDGGVDGNQSDPSLGSPKTKEIVVYTSNPRKETSVQNNNGGSDGSGMTNQSWDAIGSLAIVPSGRRHSKGGLWKKLLWKKKARGSNKKVAFPFPS